MKGKHMADVLDYKKEYKEYIHPKRNIRSTENRKKENENNNKNTGEEKISLWYT
jgi:hypothetical protein